ncbi:uncharacterized protein [Diabrotica undecimpunctata]|uniref:uncharacterized protein n=1 Tax=Diabrotica undecimpunctata TaxID=50387 RepID=UPI003B6382BE
MFISNFELQQYSTMMKFVLFSVLVALAVADPQPGAVEILGGVANTLNAGVNTAARTAKSLLGVDKPKVTNLNICAAGIASLYPFYASIGVSPIPGTLYCSCPPGYNYLNVPYLRTA